MAVFAIVLTMLLILAVAGLVVVYVAYPHRGREVPRVPWLGETLQRWADRLPVVTEQEGSETTR